MLAHDVRSLKHHYADPNSYVGTALKDDNLLDGLHRFFVGVNSVYGSVEVRSPHGTFRKGEVLLFHRDGQWHAAKAQVFMKIVLHCGASHFVAVVDVLRRVGADEFSLDEVRPVFMPLSAIRTHCTYQAVTPILIRLIRPLVL